jgi:hypothetical protein
MTCDEARALLADAAAGPVPPDVAAHAATCSSCDAELRALRDVVERLRAAPEPDFAGLAAATSPDALARARRARSRRSEARWLSGALALSILGAAAIGLAIESAPVPDSPAPAREAAPPARETIPDSKLEELGVQVDPAPVLLSRASEDELDAVGRVSALALVDESAATAFYRRRTTHDEVEDLEGDALARALARLPSPR